MNETKDNILEFDSLKSLIYNIQLSIPDEFPSGYASYLAHKMLEEGKVKISGI